MGRAGLLEAGDASVSRNISHLEWNKVQSKQWLAWRDKPTPGAIPAPRGSLLPARLAVTLLHSG